MAHFKEVLAFYSKPISSAPSHPNSMVQMYFLPFLWHALLLMYTPIYTFIWKDCEYLSDQNRVLLVFLFLVGWIKWMWICLIRLQKTWRQDYFYLLPLYASCHSTEFLRLPSYSVNKYLSNNVNKKMLALGDLNFLIEVIVYVMKSCMRLSFKHILMDSLENLFPLPDPYEKSLKELEFSIEKR